MWNLGGYDGENNFLSSDSYIYERGTTVYSGHATTWTGKIGLMYPSDYGYATSGGTAKDRAACLAKEISNWISSDFSDCKDNNFLYDSNTEQLAEQLTMMPYSVNADMVLTVYPDGSARPDYTLIAGAVRPTLFLKSSIQVDKGTGAKSDPYVLKIQ